MKKKTIGIMVISVLCAVSLFSIIMFARQYHDARKSAESFESLSEQVDISEIPEETSEPETDKAIPTEAKLAYEKYGKIYEQNNDLVGWIKIDDTNINYPVMQSKDNTDYYLKHNFEKQYSDYGVPYMDERCMAGISNNLVVYGHHMRNGSMFHDLENFADADFCKEHQISFDTLSTLGKYEAVAVFRFDADNDSFKFNEYTEMDEEKFSEFMQEVHKRQLFDTGVDAKFGDQLLTLVTCEYTHSNGRLVVVAKKI